MNTHCTDTKKTLLRWRFADVHCHMWLGRQNITRADLLPRRPVSIDRQVIQGERNDRYPIGIRDFNHSKHSCTTCAFNPDSHDGQG